MKRFFSWHLRAAKRWLWHFRSDIEAATSVEYAVMLALILLATISAIAGVGDGTNGMWSGIIHRLNDVGFIR